MYTLISFQNKECCRLDSQEPTHTGSVGNSLLAEVVLGVTFTLVGTELLAAATVRSLVMSLGLIKAVSHLRNNVK